jgi:deoxyribonuclease V
MIACVDVHYTSSVAVAAALSFHNWEDAVPTGEHVLEIRDVEPYVPGQFYRRELPSVLKILAQISPQPDIVVIDGYVWLDSNQKRGMGAHLYAALNRSTSVIGVAKTRFTTASGSVELRRGSSKRPLFITSAGMDPTTAADCIRRMHGSNRIPTLLKRVDRLSRSP